MCEHMFLILHCHLSVGYLPTHPPSVIFPDSIGRPRSRTEAAIKIWTLFCIHWFFHAACEGGMHMVFSVYTNLDVFLVAFSTTPRNRKQHTFKLQQNKCLLVHLVVYLATYSYTVLIVTRRLKVPSLLTTLVAGGTLHQPKEHTNTYY